MQDLRPLFIPTLNSGVTYWRMFNFVQAAFRNKVMESHIVWWQKGLNEIHPWQLDLTRLEYRERILSELSICCRTADIAVMGMLHIDEGLTVLMGIREMYGIPVVMEIDDNILSCPVYNPASNCYDPGSMLRKRAIQQMRESDALIVSTPYLKEIYAEFNDNIYVIPNCMDLQKWCKLRKRNNKGKITVGWAGGAAHNDDLDIIEPAIDVITAKHPEVEFCFVHGISPGLKDKKNVRWSRQYMRIDQYPSYLAKQGFDIGLAPLVDNAFNRGKSNLRFLEYAALGVPCVASDVGHFKETIDTGVDGFLCSDTKEFIEGIELLINDSSLRYRMGRAALAKVTERFNVDNVIVEYEKVLREIKERGQVRRIVPIYKDSNYKPIVDATEIL